MKLFDFFHTNDKTEGISNPQDAIDVMLTTANNCYKQGDYIHAFQIYHQITRSDANPTAEFALGTMYANGTAPEQSYGATLTRKLNEYLQMDTWGRNFTIGSCFVAKQEAGLVLAAENVCADYQALLSEAGNTENVEQAVKRFAGNGFMAQLAAKAASAAAEKRLKNTAQ